MIDLIIQGRRIKKPLDNLINDMESEALAKKTANPERIIISRIRIAFSLRLI